MALTLANLKAVVNHELGGDPAVLVTNVDTTKQHIVNAAGRTLFSMRRWKFLERPEAFLDFTADTEYVALPSDFAELIDLGYNSTSGSVVLSTLERVSNLRASEQDPGTRYLAAVAYPTQTSQTVVPAVPRLELAPTPTETIDDALRVIYRSGWVELTSDTHASNCPLWMDPLLEQTVRAFARGREDGTLDERLASLLTGPLFRIVAERDDMAQSGYGVPVNGAARVQRELIDQTTSDMHITTVVQPS